MQGTITYNSVVTSSQTTGYQVLCQGYRSGTEDFNVQAWNYTSSAWVTKATINTGSDADYNFNLLGWNANCERSSGDVVQIRLIDASGTDSVQDTLYLDLLKIRRIEIGYALDIELTTSATNQYGNQRLGIKAYTSAETFDIKVYNWLTTTYDSTTIALTYGANTWHYFTLDTTKYRQAGTFLVKVQVLDGTSSASDLIQDACYLDVAWVTWMHSDPTITLYRTSIVEVNVGDSVTFWLTYLDSDNEAPSYVYAHIGASDYSMSANDSDTDYFDGKLYGLVKSDLTAGNTTYYFKVKDANSGDVTTSPVSLSVNTKPTLTLDGVIPNGGNPGDFDFFVTYADADSNSPKYVRAWIAGVSHDMTYNGSGGGYHLVHAIAGGTTAYYFTTEDYRSGVIQTGSKNLVVNYPPSLSNYDRVPADPVYITTEITFSVTYTDQDNTMPTSVKWRSGAQNLTMTETTPADTNTNDGKDYYVNVYLTHGNHNYDFGASDGLYWVSGGSNSITIANRDPIISNGPGASVNEYRNTVWQYDFDGTDPDTDSVLWGRSGYDWLTIDSGTGILSGTTPNTPGAYPFTVYLNDSYGGQDTYGFTLNVNNRNPVITSSGNTTQLEGTYLSYHVIANDPDSDTMTYELSTNASWASIGGEYVTGVASGLGWYEFSVWVNDSYGGSDLEHWHLTVTGTPANDPPYFTSTPVYTVTNNSLYQYDANADDPELDVLSYYLDTNASFLGIVLGTGVVSGTPHLAGSYWANVTVTDGFGWDYQNYSFDVTTTAPSFSSSPTLTGENGTAYSYHAQAIDPENDILTFAKGPLSNATFLSVGGSSGMVTGTPTLEGWYFVNISVTDGVFTVWQNYTLTIYEEVEPPPGPTGPIQISIGTVLIGVILVLAMLMIWRR